MGLTGAGGGGTHRGEGRRGVVGRLPVAGLVAAECLVGGEGLVADGALVGELEGRGRRRAVVGGGGGSGGAASGEHDEAEGEVLFFRRWVVDPRAFGALPLRPCLHLLVRERRGSCCCGAHWGVQRFKGHFRERESKRWAVWFDRVREKEKRVSKIWIVWIDVVRVKGRRVVFLEKEMDNWVWWGEKQEKEGVFC